MRSDPLNSTWHRLACVLVAGLLFVGCDDGGGGSEGYSSGGGRSGGAGPIDSGPPIDDDIPF